MLRDLPLASERVILGFGERLVAAGAQAALLTQPGDRLVLLVGRPGQEPVVPQASAVSEAEVELVGEPCVSPVLVTEKGTFGGSSFTSKHKR